MIDTLTGEEWRFATVVNPHNSADITVYRSRKWQVDDTSGDQWRWYTDSDSFIGFYDEGFRGIRALDSGADPVDVARAVVAHEAERDGWRGAEGGLDRVAQRLVAEHDGWRKQVERAKFIRVPLDRGTDLYLLTYDGDPDGEFRREVQAVWNGDVWRLEVQVYIPTHNPNIVSVWEYTDDCSEYYGEDHADEQWKAEYPLTEFPADLFV